MYATRATLAATAAAAATVLLVGMESTAARADGLVSDAGADVDASRSSTPAPAGGTASGGGSFADNWFATSDAARNPSRTG